MTDDTPAPAKAGAGALRVPVARVRRVRVPTPPPLTADERERLAFTLNAAADTPIRVLIVLVRIDGFTIADAAAIVGMTARRAAELLRSAELVGRQTLAFARRPAEEEPLPQPTPGRPAKAVTKRPAGLPRNNPKRRRKR